MIVSCKDCDHYHKGRRGYCGVHDGPKNTTTSPYDGKTTVYYGLRPTVDEMRQGECGEEATLFKKKPSWAGWALAALIIGVIILTTQKIL